MSKITLVLITLVLTSFFFFPFEFVFLPGVNTKMGMAAVGLLLLFFNLTKKRNATIETGMFVLSLWAILVSFMGLISITVNHTNDYEYATYIISMWVWTSAAYMLVSVIKSVHGYLSPLLICNYLIGVCVCQCIIALLNDMCLPVKNWLDSLVIGQEYFEENHRLYGVGAALDVAGIRMSAILIMISFILCSTEKILTVRILALYIIAYVVIAVVGNMIARTTTVGMFLSIFYVFFYLIKNLTATSMGQGRWRLFWWGGAIMLLLSAGVVFLYHTNPVLHEHIRFGYEGFFSLIEKGKWDVHSNRQLLDMYIFPETWKTWVIGDGYMNGTDNDPYYVGKSWKYYYMGTDVGYLRFIFYFGLLGLLAFIAFFIKTCHLCFIKFPRWKPMFILFLLLNFIIWFKVATDIFLVFALFLIATEEKHIEIYKMK